MKKPLLILTSVLCLLTSGSPAAVPLIQDNFATTNSPTVLSNIIDSRAALAALQATGSLATAQTALINLASNQNAAYSLSLSNVQWARSNYRTNAAGESMARLVDATNAAAGLISANVFYVSKWPGVTAVPGASTNGGIGADSGPAIQALLDVVTNFPAIEVVSDNEFITGQTLKVRSNTKLTALNNNCGFVLSNSVSQILLVNYNLNGNYLTDSNITLYGGLYFGNRWSQNRYLTNGPYYDGIFSPIVSTNEVAYTIGVNEGETHWRPWLYCVWFSGVRNLHVENVFINEARTFALTLANIAEGVIRNNRLLWSSAQDGSQDGIHTYTPLYDTQIYGNIHNGDDDTIAFNTDELAYVTNINTRVWRGTNGGGRNVKVVDNYRLNGNGGYVRIISYNSNLGKNWFTNLTIRGLRGATPSDGWIAGAVNSIYKSTKTMFDGLVIEDVKLTNNYAVGLDLSNVGGTWLRISDIVGYGIPSYYSSFMNWNLDRFTQGYVVLDPAWDFTTINNADFIAPSTATNVSLVALRYPYGRKLNHLRVSNSSISGGGVRALVANHGNIGTLCFSGISTTNAASIPEVYTAKTVSGGGTIAAGRVIGGTNYAEDTTLWLRRCRQLGYEPTPSRRRAVDWLLQFLQDTGDLASIHEIGFFAGATNINEILPKIRTYHTNEWTTNAFQINYSFASSDLSRYGLVGGGSKYLDTQVGLTTTSIGAANKTNFGVGVYLHTLDTSTSANMTYAGASYSATGDTDRFSFIARPADIWLGNVYAGVARTYTNGLTAMVVSNSTSALSFYTNGVLTYTNLTWTTGGFQAGTLWMMKGQYYATPATNTVSLWYVGNGSVNQSNVNYAARIATEMAACYSPAPVYSTGWTNFFGGTANVLIKGGINVGVTNQFGQTVSDLAAATNVTFTLKPGWIIGGSGLTGVATDLD